MPSGALFDGARTVVSAALCYYAPGGEPAPGRRAAGALHVGRPLRELREQLDALGRRLGGEYRVLVDANQHVDREGAVRAGVGFYGKNTLVITRAHGSWVVLGTLVTSAEVEPTPPLELDCGSCRLCIDACPTGALDEPGTVDSTRCLSYWTQAPAPIPEEYRAALGDQVYGCDICQDVCPWNRGVEKRRGGRRAAARGRADGRPRRVARRRRRGARPALRPPLRPAQRPALPAPERARRARATAAAPEHRDAVAAYADDPDPMLREHAELGARPARRAAHEAAAPRRRDRALDRLRPAARGPVRGRPGRCSSTDYPPGYASCAWSTAGVFAVGAIGDLPLCRQDLSPATRSSWASRAMTSTSSSSRRSS